MVPKAWTQRPVRRVTRAAAAGCSIQGTVILRSNVKWKANGRSRSPQAQQAAAGRGPLPAGLGRTIEQILQPTADWRAVLRDFVATCARNDYSWVRPNRRFIAQGLYLPGVHFRSTRRRRDRRGYVGVDRREDAWVVRGRDKTPVLARFGRVVS